MCDPLPNCGVLMLLGMNQGGTMKVRNINGTSDTNCKCGSWLQHWKNFSGEALGSYCYEVKCTKKPEVGAHVQKDESSDSSWYIIPLCTDHNNQKGETIELASGAKLVSANKKQTCER
jgi:hypothetical protein